MLINNEVDDSVIINQLIDLQHSSIATKIRFSSLALGVEIYLKPNRFTMFTADVVNWARKFIFDPGEMHSK